METTTKNKDGRITTAERLKKIQVFSNFRNIGNNIKESGQFAGMSEKTAYGYERIRLKQLQPTADLIELLESKAKAKETTAKDLVLLTKEIDRLSDKLQKTRNLL